MACLWRRARLEEGSRKPANEAFQRTMQRSAVNEAAHVGGEGGEMRAGVIAHAHGGLKRMHDESGINRAA